jgi:hypothetical protein
MKKTIARLPVLVGLRLALSHRSSNDTPTWTAQTAGTDEGSTLYSLAAKATLGYGQSGADVGVKFTVGAPEFEWFQEAEFDEACTVDPDPRSKPGAHYTDGACVRVIVENTSLVATKCRGLDAEKWTYVAPSGVASDDSMPTLMAFEDTGTDGKVCDLSPESKTNSCIYFESVETGGITYSVNAINGAEIGTWE